MNIPRKLAISDIHGCFKTFECLIRKKIKLTHSDHLHLLGDYVDRGPDSKSVIDFIIELQSERYNIHCLKGNHEDLLLNDFDGLDHSGLWRRNGGAITLKSFGVTSVKDIPDTYIRFFRGLNYYMEEENYLLSHAGFNFQVPDPLEDKHAMLWIRNADIDKEWLDGRTIVHGHTPIAQTILFKQFHSSDRLSLNIDNGCVYTLRKGNGHLCAFDMTNNELHFQKNIDVD